MLCGHGPFFSTSLSIKYLYLQYKGHKLLPCGSCLGRGSSAHGTAGVLQTPTGEAGAWGSTDTRTHALARSLG